MAKLPFTKTMFTLPKLRITQAPTSFIKHASLANLSMFYERLRNQQAFDHTFKFDKSRDFQIQSWEQGPRLVSSWESPLGLTSSVLPDESLNASYLCHGSPAQTGGVAGQEVPGYLRGQLYPATCRMNSKAFSLWSPWEMHPGSKTKIQLPNSALVLSR